MSSSALKRTSDSSSIPKLKLDCNSRITSGNPTTKEWLSNLTYLKTIQPVKSKMSNKTILEGILNKKHPVVLKISDNTENLKFEYDIYEELINNNVKQVVHYYCYFECSDTLANTQTAIEKEGICSGPGGSLRVLVMDYIKNKSFAMYEWEDKEPIKSCIKQVICVCLDAFLKCGFIHGDLNCNNILIKNTKVENITYNIGLPKDIIVAMNGYKILLMDFEASKTKGTLDKFYFGFRKLGSSMSNYFQGLAFLNQYVLEDFGNKFLKLVDNAKSPQEILSIFDLIDKL